VIRYGDGAVGDVCIGFRLQPLCLSGGFQLLVVFELRFLERLSIVVVTTGHLEVPPRCSRSADA
jgi:hypothetical protein